MYQIETILRCLRTCINSSCILKRRDLEKIAKIIPCTKNLEKPILCQSQKLDPAKQKKDHQSSCKNLTPLLGLKRNVQDICKETLLKVQTKIRADKVGG